jgi:hypothetical protein
MIQQKRKTKKTIIKYNIQDYKRVNKVNLRAQQMERLVLLMKVAVGFMEEMTFNPGLEA